MSGATQFYAVVGAGRTSDDPSGLARRRHVPGGFIDESLRRDLTWEQAAVIADWKRGGASGQDLVEVSEDEALRLVEHFRAQWAISS